MPNWCYVNLTVEATEEVIKELEEATKKNELLKFAQHYDEWEYGTFVETYGTKWEPEIHSADVESDNIQMSFDSAWAPPIAAFDLILEKEGVTSVDAFFSEEGMDFCGIYRNGEVNEASITELAEKVSSGAALTESEQELVAEFEYEIENAIEWMNEENEE